MKKISLFAVALLMTVLAVLFLQGCTGANALVTPTSATYSPVTNYVPVVTVSNHVEYVTNDVAGVPVILTNTVVAYATNTIERIVERWQTNYAPNPVVLTNLATVGSVAGVLPPPFNGLLTGILGMASAALLVYAKAKSGKLSTAESIITSVVAGVEAVGNAETKKAIQSRATAAGVNDALHETVKDVTAKI